MKHSVKRPRWWSMRFKYENCYSGFCRHCNWKKPPRAIYRAVNNLAKTMKILLLFAALTPLTAGAAETNLFNKLNFGGSVTNFPPMFYYTNHQVFIADSRYGPTNIVLTNYTGTIQIGTNYWKVADIASPDPARLCAARGHVWFDNPKFTAGFESNPGRSRKCAVCGLVQSQQPGEWK